MNLNTLKDTNNDKLNDILNELQNYDIFDFITKVSSLNLLPHNQNKCIVLDTIINAILEHKEEFFRGKSIISPKKFKDIISKAMGLPISLAIDPAEMPFIYRIQFYGNKWIFSGINTYFGFILQNFIDILFKYKNDLNPEYVAKCRNMATFILEVSTKIITDLGYGIETLGRYPSKDIVFADSKEFIKLTNSVTINISDIPNTLAPDDIEELFASFESNSIPTYNNFNNYNFFYHPLLKKSDNTAIILNPGMLPTFLSQYFLKTAMDYDEYDKIIDLYNRKVWNYSKQQLSSLGHEKINEKILDIELVDHPNYKEVLLNVCNDGILFVRYFCDDGLDYEEGNMFELHGIDTCEIEKRWKYISSKLQKLPSQRIYQMILINTFGRGLAFGFQEEQCDKSITLSPFELMCVAINERSYKNFIPRYIDSKKFCAKPVIQHDSDIYTIALYHKNKHSFYMHDDVDMRTCRLFTDYSESIDYVNKALKKEDRQLTTFPNSNYLKEIVINDEYRNIYCNTTLPPIELLNRYSNIDIWFTSEKLESADFANILYSITDLLTYWMSELRDVIEEQDFIYDSFEIKLILDGEARNYYSAQNKSSMPLSEYISFKIINNIIIMCWQPEAFLNLESQHNFREKEVIILLLEKLSQFTTKEFNNEKINNVFANPLKKKIFSLDFETNPYLKPMDLDTRQIPIEYEDELLNEIGYYFIKEKNFREGKVDESKKVDICNEAVSYLYKKLCSEVQQLNPNSLYELVCYDLEKVMYAMMLKQRRFALDITCYPEKSDELTNDFNEINKSSIALKFLMEYITAQPPKGDKILGELDYEHILSICSAIVDWARNSDLFNYKIIDSDMDILKSGRIGIDKEQIEKLAFLNTISNTKRLNENSNPFIEKFTQENLLSESPEDLDEAFLDEFGYSFTQFTCCIMDLIAIGDEIDNQVKRKNRDLICATISDHLNFEKSVVGKIINDLSLSKRDDYLKPPHGYKKIDIWPWRFNRRLSFTRKPIASVDNDLIWGNRQLYHCLLYTIDLIRDDKLPVNEKRKLKALMSKISNYSGNNFNDTVANRINSLGLFIVDSKVKKINGKRINSLDNNTLGDIDVLVINPKKKKIIVIEVKNFGFSKTPYEMHQEYLRIFCDNGEKLCYISKHKRRVEWVKTHIDDVLIQYDLQKGKWKVDDLLIVNEAIISNEYYHKNQKILLYTDIDKKSIMNI